MENKIVLFGASGHCKVVIDILQSNNEIITAIIDDKPKTAQLLGIEIYRSDAYSLAEESKLIIAIGDNTIRKAIVQKLETIFHLAIHSNAIISNYATIGEGTVIAPGVIINADAVIGKHCIINTAAIVEHDCVVEDYVHLSPNCALAGGVSVGEGTHIGIGAKVIQGIKIGKWATIGAGAVIIKDVPDYAVVVGNPGRIIKSRKK